MHKDGTNPNELHQRYIAHDVFLQHIVDHRIAAVFDDDGCPVKLLDIWERLYKNLSLIMIGVHQIPPLRCGTRR